MSFSLASVAVRGLPDEFRDAFLAVWDNFRLVGSSGTLADYEEMMAWCSPRCGYLKGKHPNDVKVFCRDGDWAVLADFSMLLIDDTDRLVRLSARFGTVIAGVTQGSSGTALFSLYENGALRRGISGSDGKVTATGQPIPEESGIDVARHFYLDEIDRLWRALGLSTFLGMPPGPYHAIHVVDTTDYGVPPAASRPKKSWWKWW